MKIQKNRISYKSVLLLIATILTVVPIFDTGFDTYGATTNLSLEEIQDRLVRVKQQMGSLESASYGMTPITAEAINEGTYDIEVKSNSPFFKIMRCKLIAEGGSLQVRMTTSSQSYKYIYLGTAAQAERAQDSDLLRYEEDGDYSVYTFSIPALNQEVNCAAFSKKKKMWYDRKLVFLAASLPEDALKFQLPDYDLIDVALRAYNPLNDRNLPENQGQGGSGSGTASTAGFGQQDQPQGAERAVKVPKKDGEYSIEVSIAGGSGRATINSPTLLTIKDGKAYATITWSSPYYDYMIVDEDNYYNQTKDGGNSSFVIPVLTMDGEMPVIADTTAMGDPVEIEYVLTFYSETIDSKGRIPQEAAKKVLSVAAVIIVTGGILNHLVKKRRAK